MTISKIQQANGLYFVIVSSKNGSSYRVTSVVKDAIVEYRNAVLKQKQR